MTGWWVAGGLLIILAGLAFAYKQLRDSLHESRKQITSLETRLSLVRSELIDVNTRRKRLLSAATQALIIVERDQTISSANKVAKRMFGPVEKETTFTMWTRHHHLREIVDKVLEGNKMPHIHVAVGDKTLEVNARPIKIKRNKQQPKEVVAAAVAINDVTEFQRLSRARRDFVANISHELRTPLASIQLLTETLLNGAIEKPDVAYKLVNDITPQIEILHQLARELLDLSMIESGQAPLKLATYSLREVAGEQLDHLRPQATRKELELHLDIDEDIHVLIDERMTGRAITNLVHNAIKFTETGGITISAYRSDESGNEKHSSSDDNGWVTLNVTDTGVGIAPDKIDRIFERFYKVDRARTGKRSGTGLGLAIAKHIVEAHGGQIWAESDGRTGTTFHLTFPLEEESIPKVGIYQD